MRHAAMIFLLLVLASCGSDLGESADPADELGCDAYEEQETDELYVQALHDCERDDETTSVYTFASSSARDSWREIAEEFGAVVLTEGDTWLEVD